MGLRPRWLVQDRLFSVATTSGERYFSSSRSTLNSEMNASLAKNKYHARIILEQHGLPNIPFARPKNLEEAQDFINFHGTTIVKPIKGSGSKGIKIINDISGLPDGSLRRYIFEKYIPGKEMRYLLLDGNIIAVHESKYGTSVEADRDLVRNSIQEQDWDSELMEVTQKIAKIFELRFITVDYMIDELGQAYILEVNTAPGLKWFHSPTSGEVTDVAQMFIKSVLAEPVN